MFSNLVAVNAKEQKFTDVPESYWAYPYITDMAERGVLDGYDDGSFQPDKPVTRAEAAAMLAQIENYRSYCDEFSDVSEDSWYAKYIGTCCSYFNKYEFTVKGKQQYYFYPDSYAEREDIIVALIKQLYGRKINFESAIIYGGISDYEWTLNKSDKDSMIINYGGLRTVELLRKNFEYESYSDCASITESKLPYIEKALSLEILTGYDDNTLRPHGTVTRAEMATLLYKLYGDRNAKDIIFGEKNYKIDCTISEFISRYNQNVKDNAKRIEYGDDDFMLQELYLNNSKVKEIESYEKYNESLYQGIRGNSKIYINNSTGKIVEIYWYKRAFYDCDTKIQNVSLTEFDNICFLMALLNISYEEASDLLYVQNHNPLIAKFGDIIIPTYGENPNSFGRSKNYLVIKDANSLTEDADFGLYPQKQNKSTYITTANDNISNIISKYNENILDNFKYLYADLRDVSPENLLVSENGSLSAYIAPDDKYSSKVEYGKELYEYHIGNLFFICNTKNELLLAEIDPTDIEFDSSTVNYNSEKVDFSNLEGICLIQAIEDISYKEAKQYYFSIINNKEFTSEKGNIYSKPDYNRIKICSDEYYVYNQELYKKYIQNLLDD